MEKTNKTENKYYTKFSAVFKGIKFNFAYKKNNPIFMANSEFGTSFMGSTEEELKGRLSVYAANAEPAKLRRLV